MIAENMQTNTGQIEVAFGTNRFGNLRKFPNRCGQASNAIMNVNQSFVGVLCWYYTLGLCDYFCTHLFRVCVKPDVYL